jgi:hypothetical protein
MDTRKPAGGCWMINATFMHHRDNRIMGCGSGIHPPAYALPIREKYIMRGYMAQCARTNGQTAWRAKIPRRALWSPLAGLRG